MTKPIERRAYQIDGLEVRESDGAASISGYAAVFDQETVIGDWYREVVRPGAFKKTLSEGADVRALWNHDTNYVLGRTKANTLELSEDKKGLKTKITPPDTQWSRDLLESIRRGDVSQMSFGFRVIQDNWVRPRKADDEKLELRELLEVELFDVSPVTFPAYEGTSISVRKKLIELGLDPEQFERQIDQALRSGGGKRVYEYLNGLPTLLENRDEDPEEEEEEEEKPEEADTGLERIKILKKTLDLKLQEC